MILQKDSEKCGFTHSCGLLQRKVQSEAAQGKGSGKPTRKGQSKPPVSPPPRQCSHMGTHSSPSNVAWQPMGRAVNQALGPKVLWKVSPPGRPRPHDRANQAFPVLCPTGAAQFKASGPRETHQAGYSGGSEVTVYHQPRNLPRRAGFEQPGPAA